MLYIIIKYYIHYRNISNPPTTSINHTRENKCERLFSELGQIDYTWSAKHTVAAYEKYHYCLQS
jgi:hypothetical protein